MEKQDECHLPDHLAEVVGLQVIDPSGVRLGVVVGRIISGTTTDLLVRRRRLFHRSRYLRLQGAAVTVTGHTLVFHPKSTPPGMRLVVLEATARDRAAGDAA